MTSKAGRFSEIKCTLDIKLCMLYRVIHIIGYCGCCLRVGWQCNPRNIETTLMECQWIYWNMGNMQPPSDFD